MTGYRLLINEAGVYVKDEEFLEQGGGHAPWGAAWERYEGSSLYDARHEGIKRRRERFPTCGKTLGEDEPMEVVWPEAKGK